MADIRISISELEKLIVTFKRMSGELTEMQNTATAGLTEMQDSWQSGNRGATFQEASGDYKQGFAKLVTATDDVLAFLQNSHDAYTRADA